MNTYRIVIGAASLTMAWLAAATAAGAQAQGATGASQAAGATDVLAEVVVTAAELQTANVKTLEDLTAFAPNIKVNAGRATNSTINAYIRVVGQNDPLWGFEPGVGGFGGVSQIGFYGPPRTYSATVGYHF